MIEAAAQDMGQTVSEYLLRAAGVRGNGRERLVSGTGEHVAFIDTASPLVVTRQVVAPLPAPPAPPKPPKPPAPPGTGKGKIKIIGGRCEHRIPIGTFCKKCGGTV